MLPDRCLPPRRLRQGEIHSMSLNGSLPRDHRRRPPLPSLGFAGGCTAPARPRPSPVLASGFKTARDHALTGTNAAIKRLVRTQSAQPDGDHRSRPLLPGLLKPGSWSSLATRISSCRWGVRSLSRSVPRRPRTAVVFRPVRWSTVHGHQQVIAVAGRDLGECGVQNGDVVGGGERPDRPRPQHHRRPESFRRTSATTPEPDSERSAWPGNAYSATGSASMRGEPEKRPDAAILVGCRPSTSFVVPGIMWSRESWGADWSPTPGRSGVWAAPAADVPGDVVRHTLRSRSARMNATAVRPRSVPTDCWPSLSGCPSSVASSRTGIRLRRLRRHSVDDAAVVDVNAARLATTMHEVLREWRLHPAQPDPRTARSH